MIAAFISEMKLGNIFLLKGMSCSNPMNTWAVSGRWNSSFPLVSVCILNIDICLLGLVSSVYDLEPRATCVLG